MQIAWYDLIPLVSWICLLGKCRFCRQPISLLYPLVELSTVVCMLFLYLWEPAHYFPVYFILFSALIVAAWTDIQAMLIFRLTSLFLVPVGIVASAAGFLPIGIGQSIAGAFLGYTVLYGINWVALRFTGRQSVGEGDCELLAMIGSFLGPWGCWTTVLASSVLGAILASLYLFCFNLGRYTRIPFAPFLALGAILSVFFQDQLYSIFVCF